MSIFKHPEHTVPTVGTYLVKSNATGKYVYFSDHPGLDFETEVLRDHNAIEERLSEFGITNEIFFEIINEYYSTAFIDA